jgi:FHA domain-containing protein
VTGATPPGQGEQTQPMAIPPWPEVAGGWPSGRAERGPYADADTIEVGGDWPDAARQPGGPLLAWLWGEQGQAGEYLLASNLVTVGRDPGSDVVLTDATVSHEHARIEHCEGQWWLQPADSAGPTWVNGQPVEPGQRVPVTDGDRLRFGFHTQFRLLVPSAR